MKKILVLLFSLIIMLSTAVIPASANSNAEHSKTIVDFDTLSASVSISGKGTYEVVDYNAIDSSYTDGKVLKVSPEMWQSFYISLPLTWKEGNPIGLQYTVMAETDTTFNRDGLGISNTNSGNPTCNTDALGGGDFTGHLSIAAGTSYDVKFDLTKVDLSSLAYSAYLSFKPESSGSVCYIDNIRLIYANESDIPNYKLEEKIFEDFENGTANKIETVGKGKFADYTDAPYNGSISLRAGKDAWDDGRTDNDHSLNYVAYKLNREDIASAYNISFWYKPHFDWGTLGAYSGVRINGKDYWRFLDYSSDWKKTDMFYSFYTYTYVYTNPDDGSQSIASDNDQGIYLTPDLIPKVEALLFSAPTHFGNSYILVDDITLSEKSESSDKIEVSMQSGASIRLNSKKGIRFYTTVNTAQIAKLRAEGKTVTLGTIIAPEDLIEGEFTHEDAHVDVKYEATEYYAENTIVGSIVNIKEGNIGRKFVGRGYVCVDGTYYYADLNDNSRSLKSISLAIKADTEKFNELDETNKQLVNKWASVPDFVK